MKTSNAYDLVFLGLAVDPSLNPLRNLRLMTFKWRRRPVPVVFLLFAFTDQLSKMKLEKNQVLVSFFDKITMKIWGYVFSLIWKFRLTIFGNFPNEKKTEIRVIFQLTWSDLGCGITALRTSRFLNMVRRPSTSSA